MKTITLALAIAALAAGTASAQVPTGKMGELRPDQGQIFGSWVGGIVSKSYFRGDY